jgi:hypothetical protein
VQQQLELRTKQTRKDHLLKNYQEPWLQDINLR